jgi:sugar phosphate isomerase/epimerase
MKTSVSLALQLDSVFSPFTASDFEAGLDWAHGLGFDGVELIINDPLKVNARELSEKIEFRGLSAATIATGQMIGDGLTFCDESQSVRERSVERIFQHIELSAALIGRPNVTIGLARGKGSEKPEERIGQLEWITGCIKKCAAYATKKNVVINLEPINRYETFFLNSCEQTAQKIKEIGMPNIGLLYDTFHSNIEDGDMLLTINHYGKLIAHVHFADSNRHVPGEGHIPFARIVKKLTEKSYDGYVSLEVLNLPHAEDVIIKAGNLNRIIKGL